MSGYPATAAAFELPPAGVIAVDQVGEPAGPPVGAMIASRWNLSITASMPSARDSSVIRLQRVDIFLGRERALGFGLDEKYPGRSRASLCRDCFSLNSMMSFRMTAALRPSRKISVQIGLQLIQQHQKFGVVEFAVRRQSRRDRRCRRLASSFPRSASFMN